MGYYVRTFCTSSSTPSLQTLVEWAGARGVHLEVDVPDGSGDLEALDWRETNSSSKRRVVDHLKNAECVVAAQLLGDIDDDGQVAAMTILGFFLERCGGLILTDGEGFYDGEDVIVELE